MSEDYSKFSKEAQTHISKIDAQVLQDPESIYDDCQELLRIAAEDSSDGLMGLGYYFMAEYYLGKSDADQVMDCLVKAIKYFPKCEMYTYLAKSYNIMGAVVDSQNNKSMAMDYYAMSIQYCKKYNIPYVYAMVENNVASILHNMGEDEKAVKFLKSAIVHYEEAEEMPRTKWNILLTLISLGYCYLRLGLYRNAEAIEQQILGKIEGKAEDEIPVFAINIWRAEMENYCGNKIGAVEYVEKVLEGIVSNASFIEYSDYLMDVAKLLMKMEEYSLLLKILLSVKTWRNWAEDVSLEERWYFYLLNCYEKLGMQEEYINVSKTYFKLCENREASSKENARKAIALRDKLSIIQQRENDMMMLDENLRLRSQHDPLTGLANRTYFNDYFEKQLALAKREQKKLTLELMDIDSFKKYNEFYGHLAGDICLEKIAMVLKRVENDKIFCARHGGDEFMMVYYDMSDEEVKQVASQIQENVINLAIPHAASEIMPYVTISQGIVSRTPQKLNRVWDYSASADQLLQEVKKNGKNGIKMECI